MSKLLAAFALVAVASGCASQSQQPYESDKAACIQRGYAVGSPEYTACLQRFDNIYDERSNRWRVEQSN
jgi:hypothetical protein